MDTNTTTDLRQAQHRAWANKLPRAASAAGGGRV
jgi:hypothetical protein